MNWVLLLYLHFPGKLFAWLAKNMNLFQNTTHRINAQNELAERIQQKAEQAAGKLDQIKQMILSPPEGADLAALIQEAKQLLYNSNVSFSTATEVPFFHSK